MSPYKYCITANVLFEPTYVWEIPINHHFLRYFQKYCYVPELLMLNWSQSEIHKMQTGICLIMTG